MQKKDIPFRKLKARWAYIVPGRIPFETMSAIVAQLRKNGASIAMNPSSYYLKLGAKKLMPILRELDLIILNREEAAYLTGFRYNEEQKIFKKFDELVRGLAIMTDGPKGVLVSDGKKVYRAGIYKEKLVADRTGAGDSFGSGFVAGIMRRNRKLKVKDLTSDDIVYAIQLASANATANVEQVGAETGILRKGQFEKEKRWRTLPVKITDL